MRRFKNLEIGGIESKIFNLILLTVIVLTVLFVIFSTSQSKMLSALTSETSVRQQQTTSGIISDTMTQVTQISMESITDMEAQIVDEMFQDIRARVMLVADYCIC
jgi:sigma-B regulation protein RsbU (phosphoserine phosphatase)